MLKKSAIIICAAAALAYTHSAFADDGSGQCGDNAYWSFTDGTLTISGTGETYNIDRDFLSWQKPDWAEYEDRIENVVVKEGITSIGRQLFRGSPLKTLSLPSTLTAIGGEAFRASELTSLSLPQSVVNVGYNSFSGCDALEEINMPKDMYTKAGQLFKATLWFRNELKEHGAVILGDVLAGIESIEDGELRVPDGIRVIGESAFRNIKAQKVILPEGVEEICENGFYDVEADTVLLPNTLKKIGKHGFFSSEITEMTLPESALDIGEDVFTSCSKLKRVHLPEKMTEIPAGTFTRCKELAEVNTPKRLESIGGGAFSQCYALNSFEMPDTLTRIGAEAFYDAGITEAKLPDSVSEIGKRAFYMSNLKELRLPRGIKVIPVGLAAYTKLETMTLPDGTEEIGNDAFWGCKSLKTINFPSSLKRIGNYSFRGCETFVPPEIHKGITAIGVGAFAETAVRTLILHSGMEIGSYAFENCKQLTSVVFEDGYDSVPDAVFFGCELLGSVTLPRSVRGIGASAFRQCKSLEEISIPDGVDSIAPCAFEESGLRSVRIPEGVTEISDSCFSRCGSLAGIDLPPQLEKIGNSAFEGCILLEEVMIPETVTEISGRAFGNCSALTKADLPPNLNEIGVNMFTKCPLDEVYVPEGVTSIGAYALDSAKELHIPPSVIKIEKNALPAAGTVYAQPGSYAYGFAVKQGLSPISDYEMRVGDIIDHIVQSDIYVTMNGELIPSYCISGRTVVLLRDLERHGFDVWFDEENKRAYAQFDEEKELEPGGALALENNDILHTDIKAVVNGTEIECINTNGYVGIEAEKLGNYAPYISCVWQPLYRRLQMQSFKGMAHFDDLVNAISDRKGIKSSDGCASFADTDNGRYEVFAQRGYISRADYNGYIYPLRGLRMSDFILTAGRAYFGTELDYKGHSSYGSGLEKLLRRSDIPNYMVEYANCMYEAGILVPDENGGVYLDGILTAEQMEYYLDVLSILNEQPVNG